MRCQIPGAPTGWVCNATWEHLGDRQTHCYTHPLNGRSYTYTKRCGCVECMAAMAEELGLAEECVIGPVWLSNHEFNYLRPQMVGIWRRDEKR